MPKIKTEKVIEELFGSNIDKKENLICPKCRNTNTFTTSTTAIAKIVVDRSRALLDIKELTIDFDESIWQCEECSCVFDEYGDMLG